MGVLLIRLWMQAFAFHVLGPGDLENKDRGRNLPSGCEGLLLPSMFLLDFAGISSEARFFGRDLLNAGLSVRACLR